MNQLAIKSEKDVDVECYYDFEEFSLVFVFRDSGLRSRSVIPILPSVL
jgi:hypothetical protein